MNIEHTTLKVPGLKHPLRLFHITDSHITSAYPQAPEKVQSLAEKRTEVFRLHREPAKEILEQMLETAKLEKADCVLFTGDIVDFPSDANLTYLHRILSRTPSYFYVPGNHDWVYPWDCPPTAETEKNYKTRLAEAVNCPLDYAEKDLGEVLLVGIDNGYYRVSEAQYDKVKHALEQEKPVILCCHVPLYIESLVPETEQVWNCPILMGCPLDICRGRKFGSSDIESDEVTRAFLDMVASSDKIAAVVTGHLHFSHSDLFASGTPQYVTDCTPRGAARVIELVP